MRPHQPLLHRLEHRFLFVGIIQEAERAARIHQRMLADHVLDLGLGVVVERVVGRAHVGEFGVAALRVHHPRRQSSFLVMVPPRAFSRSPKFSAKASCCSSVMSWLRNSSTAYLSMPASMSAASCGVRGFRKSTPETSPKKNG